MSETVTARDELYEVAELLHDADGREKAAKAEKEEARGAFFDLISEVVREEVPLARKVVTEPIDPEEGFVAEACEAWRAFHYPTWNIIAMQPESDGEGPATRVVITLEENDQFKKFEFVHGGYKFGRTIRMEGKDFKAEAFLNGVKDLDIDPELRNELAGLVKSERIVVYEVDEDKALKLMAEHPETVLIFQRYMFPGTPRPALIPIKAVKES